MLLLNVEGAKNKSGKMRIINVCFYCPARTRLAGCSTDCIAMISFQVLAGGDIKKFQVIAKNMDDPFYALNYYYDGKLTTSRY